MKSNRPASHRQTILMCCDDNYFPFATLLAKQIHDAWPKRGFDICLLHSGNSGDHPLVEKLDLRIVNFDIPDSWQSLATSNKITLAAYLRIIAPRVLSSDYDRILYLDSDIVYLRGDLDKLFALDIGDHPIAAVRDAIQHRDANRIPVEFKAKGLDAAPYFNSGVQLIDVPNFLAQHVEERAFELTKSDEDGARIKHDQSALNLALHGKWAELSPVWNWPCLRRYFFLAHFVDPCFVHFFGKRKPWKDNSGIYPETYVRMYHDHLHEWFPEHAQKMPNRPKPGGSPGTWANIYLKNFLDTRRIAPYLGRFSSDYDVQ